MREGLTAAVIAGGAGRRMGTDKRAMLVDGVPLLARSVAAVSRVADEILVSTMRGRPVSIDLPDVRVVEDRVPDGGPLAGIEAALAAASYPLVLVVAADMPWLAEGLLELLVTRARVASDAGAVAIRSDRGLEPLLAVYRRTTLTVVTGLVDSGEHRVGHLLEMVVTIAVPPEEWRRVDPYGRSLVNLNAPDDLPT